MSEFFINTFTHPAFTAAIGFLAGHFLAIGRDRRKEFNEAAGVIYRKLIEERRNPNPFNFGPTDSEFDVFGQHLSARKRSSFYNAIGKYNKAKEGADIGSYEGVIGGGHYTNPSLIVKEIDNLLKFTKRR